LSAKSEWRLVGRCLWTIGITGAVTSLFHPDVLMNVLYSAGFIGMCWCCWGKAPCALERMSIDHFIDLAFAPLVLCAFACTVFRNVQVDGRFFGVFYTVAQAAWSASLVAVVALYRLTRSRGVLTSLYMATLGICLWIVMMAKMRSMICATIGSVLAMLLYLGRYATSPRELVVRRAIIVCMVLSVAAIFFMPGSELGDLASHLRFTDERGDVKDTRSENWQQGLAAMNQSLFVGNGWLSRWGEGTSTGSAEYTFEDDSESSIITLGKSLGIVGFVFGAFLFAKLSYVSMKCVLQPRGIEGVLLVMLGVWVVITSFFGNTLLSFGSTADRYCLILMSVMIFRREPAGDTERHIVPRQPR